MPKKKLVNMTVEELQKQAAKLEVEFTPENTKEELISLIENKDAGNDEVEENLSVAKAIEVETENESKAKKNLRQVFRNYIKQNPEKAEAEKEDLIKQLNSI